MADIEHARKRSGVAFQVLILAVAVWLLLSVTPPGRGLVEALRNALPRWSLVTSLVALPILLGLAAAPWRMSFGVRFLASVLAATSFVVSQGAVRMFVGAYAIMLAVLFLEVYWLIPTWRARRRRTP